MKASVVMCGRAAAIVLLIGAASVGSGCAAANVTGQGAAKDGASRAAPTGPGDPVPAHDDGGSDEEGAIAAEPPPSAAADPDHEVSPELIANEIAGPFEALEERRRAQDEARRRERRELMDDLAARPLGLGSSSWGSGGFGLGGMTEPAPPPVPQPPPKASASVAATRVAKPRSTGAVESLLDRQAHRLVACHERDDLDEDWDATVSLTIRADGSVTGVTVAGGGADHAQARQCMRDLIARMRLDATSGGDATADVTITITAP